MEIHEVLDLLAQTPRSEWADLDLSKYADADNGVAEQEADGLRGCLSTGVPLPRAVKS